MAQVGTGWCGVAWGGTGWRGVARGGVGLHRVVQDGVVCLFTSFRPLQYTQVSANPAEEWRHWGLP